MSINSNNLKSLSSIDAHEVRKRRRERWAIGFLFLVFVGLTIAEFRLSGYSKTLPFVTSIFFFGLLNINLVILIALVWLVVRNLGKLFIDRRRKILGARLKSKLVMAFVAFAIIPTLCLFIISAMYINSSFDSWFSIRIRNTLQASLDITAVYYRALETNARHFADHLAGRLKSGKVKGIQGFLDSQRELLTLDAVEYYVDRLGSRIIAQRPLTEDRPHFYPRLSVDLLDRAFGGEKVSVIQRVGNGNLVRVLVPVGQKEEAHAVIAVSSYVPVSLHSKVDEIASVIEDYRETNPLKYPIKTTYFVILIMITLVIIFVAIWSGIYLARELTTPVEGLVRGAQAVGAGDLSVKIEGRGHDELATLVDSFNKMTHDLRENRARLDEASADLERRRFQLEAVITNISAGVMAVDSQGQLALMNRSAVRMLDMTTEAIKGVFYRDILKGALSVLADLVERALSPGSITDSAHSETVQWTMQSEGGPRILTATAKSLRESGEWGVVVVIDDMTLIVKGQRENAWREVAKRIAHEIKNPLTPIKLSAQRLQRRFSKLRDEDGQILHECADVIVRHTDELRDMVNEFSQFARFPETNLALGDLNAVIREIETLYSQAHPEIQFQIALEQDLPHFEFDRDQLKRVIINLIDNAVAALLERRGAGIIRISTKFLTEFRLVSVRIEDNGPGMSDETRSRVFEPYFSTKKSGTGLGLSIAKRIINDHDGFIRVHSKLGKGTQFVIEVPGKGHVAKANSHS